MIRLSQPVASDGDVVLYADDAASDVVFYMPRMAEVCSTEEGATAMVHRRFRVRGSRGPGISVFNVLARGAISDGRLHELAARVVGARGRPPAVCPAPVWAVGVSVLDGNPGSLLVCSALQTDLEVVEALVTIVAPERAERSVISCLGSSSGLRLSLEHRITGAGTPLRATARADLREVHARLSQACLPTGFISWDEVSHQVQGLLAHDVVQLSPAANRPGREDAGYWHPFVPAVTHYLINSFMGCEQLPRRATPYPSLHASWFRMNPPPAARGTTAFELAASDLETRALGVTLHLRRIGAEEFLDGEDTCDELTPPVAEGLARHGIDVGAVLGSS